MPTVEQSIDVNVDASTAYDQWTRFESFPQWMEGVASVDQIDDTHLHWVAKVKNEVAEVENETREWDAQITGRIRDERISWESVGGDPDAKPNAGQATFEPLGDSACRVTFRMEWEPDGKLKSNESYVLAAVTQVVTADLARFKDFIEARGEETGSWRGEMGVCLGAPDHREIRTSFGRSPSSFHHVPEERRSLGRLTSRSRWPAMTKSWCA